MVFFILLGFSGCAEKYIPEKGLEKSGATLILPADKKAFQLKFAISENNGQCAKTVYLNDASYTNKQKEMITKIPTNKSNFIYGYIHLVEIMFVVYLHGLNL